MNQLEKISKFIPLGSLILIVFSAIKLIIYYGFFDVNITDFLSMQEYLTLFIDDILLYVATFSFGGLLHIWLSRKIENDTNPIPYLSWPFILVLLWIIIMCFPLYKLVISENMFEKLIYGKSLLLFFILNLYLILTFRGKKMNYIATLVFVIFGWLFFDAYIDAYGIIEKEPELIHELKSGKEVYTTNDELKYLGKTEKYIFLYDLNYNKTIILPSTDLIRMEIKSNESPD